MTASITYTLQRCFYLSRDGAVLFPEHRRKSDCRTDVPWLPLRIMPLEDTDKMIGFILEGLKEPIPVNESIPVHPLDERLSRLLLACTGNKSDSKFQKNVHSLYVRRDASGEFFLNIIPSHERDSSKGWYRISLGMGDIGSVAKKVVYHLNELHDGTINFIGMTRVQ